MSLKPDKGTARGFSQRLNKEAQSVVFKVVGGSKAYSVEVYTQVSTENEHIYLPNQQFRVIKVVHKSDDEGIYTKIILREIQ